MPATQIRRATALDELVAGVRTVVAERLGWPQTAHLVADQVHTHGTDITRLGSSARRHYD